eukprot:NODE_659_length_1421_cov_468.073939.p1 GENE.NODE_659_length_1421_cov_468.073939~~NODE_659_length_1421_cov_468.073939.p1  ORF type:complete len:425 (-),score=104.16 NODE_659_length_1421_cov_468.073939:129-1214(-)
MFLEQDPPVFKEGLFTDYGKWMDGWESRRKRQAGHDWCIVELGAAGIIRGFDVDTAFFTGNNVPAIGVMGCHCPGLTMPAGISGTSGKMGTCATPEDITKADEHLKLVEWVEVLAKSPLHSGYEETRHNYFWVTHEEPLTHLRVNYYPDGGVARFRAYGEVHFKMPRPVEELIDFAASWHGGAAVAWSNAHYGAPRNCLAPGRAAKMDEGWETARNPHRPEVLQAGKDGLVTFDYAKDWFIIKLGARCAVEEIEIDTNHFKGNFPESCLIEGMDDPWLAERPLLTQMQFLNPARAANPRGWREVLPRTRCVAHAQKYFRKSEGAVHSPGPVTHLRVTIFPDGGISRVRVFGRHCAHVAAKL